MAALQSHTGQMKMLALPKVLPHCHYQFAVATDFDTGTLPAAPVNVPPVLNAGDTVEEYHPNGEANWTWDGTSWVLNNFAESCCPRNYQNPATGDLANPGGESTVDLLLQDGTLRTLCEGINATPLNDLGATTFDDIRLLHVDSATRDGKSLVVDAVGEHTELAEVVTSGNVVTQLLPILPNDGDTGNNVFLQINNPSSRREVAGLIVLNAGSFSIATNAPGNSIVRIEMQHSPNGGAFASWPNQSMNWDNRGVGSAQWDVQQGPVDFLKITIPANGSWTHEIRTRRSVIVDEATFSFIAQDNASIAFIGGTV